MKKLLRAGWLVMAATLVLGMTACSSDNTIAEEPTPQQPANAAVTADGKVHVTVGAGISDDEETRSAVVEGTNSETGGMTRTLTFTLPVGEQGDEDYSPGDRLYIHGNITPDERTMGGLLTITGVSDDGKSATFEGDLTVKVKDGGTWKDDDTGWAATQTDDPMTWYGTNDITGMLIHAATADNAPIYIFNDDGSIRFNYEYSIVSGGYGMASKLMESALNVKGYYDTDKKNFVLGCSDAIFKCTFRGLETKTKYYVHFMRGDTEDEYNHSLNNNGGTFYNQTVTTDGYGTLRFAFSTNSMGKGYYGLHLCTDNNFDNNVLNYIIGQRDHDHGGVIEAKVYKISRNWTGTEFITPAKGSGGVQLWEDGPYWAECNVGAEEPEEYGYYFWWGDIVGYTRSGGTWDERTSRFYDVTWVSSTGQQMDSNPFEDTCPTMNMDNSTLDSEGWIDVSGQTVSSKLAPEHDAATKYLGAPWRMPTQEEIEALVNNCTTTWVTDYNGVKGRLVTGKGAYADRSIFLPATGYGSYGEMEDPAGSNNFRTVVCLFNVGSQGYYWSSTPHPGRISYAWRLHFTSKSFSQQYSNYRYYGQSVRPVRDGD